MILRFFSDAGHGWLEVPKTLVRELGVWNKVSQFSFHRGEFAYLEEDCDAGLVMQALADKGIDFAFDEIYQEDSPIRNYRYWGE